MMAAPGWRARSAGGDQPHQVVALDKSSLFVEEKAAVEVAVPGQAQVGAMFPHRFGRDPAIFRQQGVGHPLGKSRVRGVADLDEPEGEVGLQGVEHRPGAAVAGVHHHLEGFEAGGVDIAQEVGDIIGQGVRGFTGPPGAGGGGQFPGRGQPFDLVQPGVAAQGPGPLPDELHAVVFRGVVAGGDHDAAVQAQMGGGEVDLLRAAEPQVPDLDPGVVETGGQGLGQGQAGEAYIPPHRHPGRGQEGGISPADPVGQVLVEFAGDPAPDVIGFKTA